MMRQTLCFALVATFFAGACDSADTVGGPVDPPPAGSTRERLATPRSLAIAPYDSEVSVTAIRNGSTPEGDLAMDRFEVALDDVVLSEETIPPHGVTLTGIRLSLAEPALAQATWFSDGDVASAEATVDLWLDWAIQGDDGPLPLAGQ